MNTKEHDHVVLGVAGRMMARLGRANGLWTSQTWKTSRTRGPLRLVVTLRFDDECKNGHNSFAITADMYDRRVRREGGHVSGGCLHDEIRDWFPELAPLIQWHLMSTDGPMHYIANTLYWAGHAGYCDGKPGSPPNYDYARSTAVWPDMPDELLADAARLKAALQARLGDTVERFRADMEACGFAWEAPASA